MNALGYLPSIFLEDTTESDQNVESSRKYLVYYVSLANFFLRNNSILWPQANRLKKQLVTSTNLVQSMVSFWAYFQYKEQQIDGKFWRKLTFLKICRQKFYLETMTTKRKAYFSWIGVSEKNYLNIEVSCGPWCHVKKLQSHRKFRNTEKASLSRTFRWKSAGKNICFQRICTTISFRFVFVYFETLGVLVSIVPGTDD